MNKERQESAKRELTSFFETILYNIRCERNKVLKEWKDNNFKIQSKIRDMYFSLKEKYPYISFQQKFDVSPRIEEYLVERYILDKSTIDLYRNSIKTILSNYLSPVEISQILKDGITEAYIDDKKLYNLFLVEIEDDCDIYDEDFPLSRRGSFIQDIALTGIENVIRNALEYYLKKIDEVFTDKIL